MKELFIFMLILGLAVFAIIFSSNLAISYKEAQYKNPVKVETYRSGDSLYKTYKDGRYIYFLSEKEI